MDIQCLQKVAQALEARAVANPLDVFLKKSVVTVLSPEVGVHHVGDVANAPRPALDRRGRRRSYARDQRRIL